MLLLLVDTFSSVSTRLYSTICVPYLIGYNLIVNVESGTMKKERGQLFPERLRTDLSEIRCGPSCVTSSPYLLQDIYLFSDLLDVRALAIKSSADGRWESTLDHTDTEIFLELRPYAHDLTFSTGASSSIEPSRSYL